MLTSQDEAQVRSLPFFRDLGANVTQLLEAATVHHFAAGSVLFREGEIPQFLHIALDGYVCLITEDGRGRQCIIDFVPAGSPFLIPPLLLDKPYLMSASVVVATRVLFLPAHLVSSLAATDLATANAIGRAASQHWRALVGQVKSLKLQSAAQRLGGFLMSLAEYAGTDSVVELPCERRMLAAWLGISPNSISRAFHELKLVGVEDVGRRIVIRSLDGLRKFVSARPLGSEYRAPVAARA